MGRSLGSRFLSESRSPWHRPRRPRGRATATTTGCPTAGNALTGSRWEPPTRVGTSTTTVFRTAGSIALARGPRIPTPTTTAWRTATRTPTATASATRTSCTRARGRAIPTAMATEFGTAARTPIAMGSRTPGRTRYGRGRTRGSKCDARKPAARPPAPRAAVDPRARRREPPSGGTGTTPPPAPAGFVARSGAQLLLNGAPYRFTRPQHLQRQQRRQLLVHAGLRHRARQLAGRIGTGKEAFRAWFFQYEATRNGARDWSAFDHTLAVARARGVRVVATLVNQWGQCEGWGAYADGYKTESWYGGGYKTLPRAPACPPPTGSGSPRSSRATRTTPRSWRGSS